MMEQREDYAGYIWYMNKTTGKASKNDPNLMFVLYEINSKYSGIKYSIYRAAQKLFTLQNALLTIKIPFPMISSILEHHKLFQVDTMPEIKPLQLTSVIFDIYYAAQKFGFFEGVSFEIQRSCSMMTNFIWNIFDPNRTTAISVLELKQTFLVLCDSQSLDDIIYEHFMLVADHNRCASRVRFEAMIRTFSKILHYLGENDNFHAIPNIVGSCFAPCPGIVGLNEHQFNCMWKSETSEFTKYSNIIRLTRTLKESQNVLHYNVKCVACSVFPLRGLRFKCQRCKNFSLCLVCFSSGFSTKNHDISHRMYEISSQYNDTSRLANLLAKMTRIFSFCSRSSMNSTVVTTTTTTTTDMRAQLIEETDTEMELKSMTSNPNVTFNRKSTCEPSQAASIYNLSNIIEVLIAQNEILNKALKCKNPQLPNLVENHMQIIAAQIEQLKAINSRSQTLLLPSSSTPLRRGDRLSIKNPDLSSPLSRTLHCAESNKTNNDLSKSDMSIRDVSSWFTNRKSLGGSESKTRYAEESKYFMANNGVYNVETHMINFKDLLSKVKEIVDDSYSDNFELSKATQQLEKVLDDIIGVEEKKRQNSP